MKRIALLAALAALPAHAQQPVAPLPKTGACPFGYYAARDYCVPSRSVNTGGAIQKSGDSCPFGFYSSGNYCVSNPRQHQEAIPRTGTNCPFGWFSAGGYCVRSRR